jgi:Kef-type K+ transport system membrane component KefB
MMDDRRKDARRWWEILVPLFVLVVGLSAPPKPLDHGIYALFGVLICAVAAWLAVVLVRRCRVVEFLKKLGSEQIP